MAENALGKEQRSTTRRTLQHYWAVTKTQPGMVSLSLVSTLGFVFLLSYANPYIIGRIVDRIAAGSIAANRVLEVFGPYILALILVAAVVAILLLYPKIAGRTEPQPTPAVTEHSVETDDPQGGGCGRTLRPPVRRQRPVRPRQAQGRAQRARQGL